MTWGLFFVKDPQSFKDFTCREHIHRKNNDLYDFFGDLVGSVVSISNQTREDSPRGIMMTELLNLKVLSNQTSGLVVGEGGGGGGGEGGRPGPCPPLHQSLCGELTLGFF